jgi:hypothetical protein
LEEDEEVRHLPSPRIARPFDQFIEFAIIDYGSNFSERRVRPAELDGRVVAELNAVRGDQAFLRSLFHASELPIPLPLLS